MSVLIVVGEPLTVSGSAGLQRVRCDHLNLFYQKCSAEATALRRQAKSSLPSAHSYRINTLQTQALARGWDAMNSFTKAERIFSRPMIGDHVDQKHSPCPP